MATWLIDRWDEDLQEWVDYATAATFAEAQVIADKVDGKTGICLKEN